MHNIHVLHVLNSAHGGSAMSTFELIGELNRNGIKSSLVCFNNASSEQQQKIEALVRGRVLFIPLYWMNRRIRVARWKRPILELLSFWRTWNGHRFQSRISRLIKNEKINLIHTSTILNPEGAIAARRNNIPHVWHVRELVGPDKHFHFYNYAAWSAYVHSHCEYLVANSSITKKCLLQFFPQEKIKCIPNGLSLSSYTVKEHTEEKKIVVGMVGSVTSRWKNHEFFIRTAAVLAGDDRLDFRIYGALPGSDDPYVTQLNNLIHSLGTSNVSFFAFKKPEDIMREIDLLFHPTDLESFGRIFVEAMGAGLPIVAVNEGGSLELVLDGVNGFLIPLNDTAQAAAAITRLAGSPDLRNDFGRKGRALAEQKYTLERLGNSMAELYREVTSKSNV